MSQLSVKEIEEAVKEKHKNTKRLIHILGVADLAKKLANIYSLDSEKAYIAGLLHDYCKYESIDEMKKIIGDEFIIKKYEKAPEIYHAYASSVLAKEKFLIEDREILDAIKYHVYGRIGMSLFEKIIVIADYCEDSRENERCKEVRKILDEGKLDLALYLSAKYSIEFVISKGGSILEEQYIILKELEKNI